MKSGRSKLYKHPKCATLYVSIPAPVVHDSTFPFKAGDRVTVAIYDISTDPSQELNVLLISKETKKK